jgi:hypothetical protein
VLGFQIPASWRDSDIAFGGIYPRDPCNCHVNESLLNKRLRGMTTGIVLSIEEDRGTVFSADDNPVYTFPPHADT